MNKSKILIVALSAVLMLSLIAGCSNSVNADNGTGQPDTINLDPVADEAIGAIPLANEELAYFNGDDFFNGEYLNIRNQFLSSLYSTPEEIDLFELFYCGTGLEESRTAEEERDISLAFYGDENAEPHSPTIKISIASIDTILTQYMGLTLADTDKIGLDSDNMIYLEEYDAYYIHHGDTNYRGHVTFSAGVREGDIIRLFYEDTFFGDGGKVLTLRETDGNYLFVSNCYLPTDRENDFEPNTSETTPQSPTPPVAKELVSDYVETYLQHIINGDTDELARFLLIDGGVTDKYIEIARRVIEHYATYDLHGATVKNVEYAEIGFTRQYTILVCDGRGEMFTVEAGYGDSLVGIDISQFE